MSPTTKRDTQSAYCTRRGRSVPISWLRASTARWSANGPSIARPILPGSTWAPAKTMMLSTQSVTSDRPRRFRRNVIMAVPPRLLRPPPTGSAGGGDCPACAPLLERRLVHEQVAHCRRLDAGCALLRRRQEVVEVGEQDRRFIEQQVLDLAGCRALRVQVQRCDVAVHQLVILGILEVRRVPGAVAPQRR